MKLNFEAIADRVAPDAIVRMIVEEVGTRFGLNPKKEEAAAKAETKKGLFSGKKA